MVHRAWHHRVWHLTLVVTLVFNGMVEPAANDARMLEAVDAIYADLGIT